MNHTRPVVSPLAPATILTRWFRVSQVDRLNTKEKPDGWDRSLSTRFIASIRSTRLNSSRIRSSRAKYDPTVLRNGKTRPVTAITRPIAVSGSSTGIPTIGASRPPIAPPRRNNTMPGRHAYHIIRYLRSRASSARSLGTPWFTSLSIARPSCRFQRATLRISQLITAGSVSCSRAGAVPSCWCSLHYSGGTWPAARRPIPVTAACRGRWRSWSGRRSVGSWASRGGCWPRWR